MGEELSVVLLAQHMSVTLWEVRLLILTLKSPETCLTSALF